MLQFILLDSIFYERPVVLNLLTQSRRCSRQRDFSGYERNKSLYLVRYFRQNFMLLRIDGHISIFFYLIEVLNNDIFSLILASSRSCGAHFKRVNQQAVFQRCLRKMSDIWITPHLTDSNVVIQGTDYTGDIPFEHDKTV